MNLQDHFPVRVIFTVVMILLTAILYFIRGIILNTLQNRPLGKRFLRGLQVVLPSCFTLLFSFWFRQVQRPDFYSALLWIVTPFYGFYLMYHYVLTWAEDRISDELKKEKLSRNDEIAGFKGQIDRLIQIVTLEEYMQKLIKSKAKRFLDFYKIIKAGKVIDKPDEVFNVITQPKEQLVAMVALAHEYFSKHIVPYPHHCNVTVMVPEGDKLVFTYYKETPLSAGKDIFYYGRSAAGKAWQKGKILIIPDKHEELKKTTGHFYEQGERNFTEDGGSLICYPVFDFDAGADDRKSSLIFIINITSTKPNNFAVEDEAHYEKILSSLAERMVLENRLIKIKEVVGKKS